MADRPGAAGALPREGAARGEADDELARAGRVARAAREGLRARPLLEPGAPRRLRAVRGACRAGRRARVARGTAPPPDEPGPAGPLPGCRARVAQPRRPRQPPADRLERPRFGAPGAGTDPADAEG